MGKGGQKDTAEELIPWSEVAKHTAREDKWIVIHGDIFDITNWARKHPGGSRVISHYAGEDATVSVDHPYVLLPSRQKTFV